MTDLEIITGQTIYLEFTIKDSDGNYFDLTGASATLQVKKYGESTLRINGSCEIHDPTNGKCRYLYQDDLPTGDYQGELEIVDNAGLKYITPTFSIKVIADLP